MQNLEEKLKEAFDLVAEARSATLGASSSSSKREIVQKLLSSPTNLDLVSTFQALNNLGFKLSVIPA
jgi:DNA-binding phage protein